MPGAALLSIAQRRLREVKQLAWIDQLRRPNQQAGVGGAHQLRTCSVFYNQSHTQVDPSGPTASHSLIKTEQTSHLPCKVAIRECRVHKHNKHRFCASDQGPDEGEAIEAPRPQHRKGPLFSGAPCDLRGSTPLNCVPRSFPHLPLSMPCLQSTLRFSGLNPTWDKPEVSSPQGGQVFRILSFVIL